MTTDDATILVALGAFVLSGLMFFAGRTQARRQDSERRVVEQHEAARIFISVTTRAARSLRSRLASLDSAETLRAVHVYFIYQGPFLSQIDERELASAIAQRGKFAHHCSESWREAAESLLGVHKRHEELRKRGALPGAAQALTTVEGYRRQLEHAESTVKYALRQSQRYAPQDSIQLITDCLRRS